MPCTCTAPARSQYLNRIGPDLSEPIDLHLQDDGFDKDLIPTRIQVSNDRLQLGCRRFLSN